MLSARGVERVVGLPDGWTAPEAGPTGAERLAELSAQELGKVALTRRELTPALPVLRARYKEDVEEARHLVAWWWESAGVSPLSLADTCTSSP